MNTHLRRLTTTVLVLLVACLSAQAGNVWLDYNRDALGRAPQNGASTGSVKIVQHSMKPKDDQCVGMVWDNAKDRPEYALATEDKKVPLRGILRFDMLFAKRGAGMEVVGLSNRGHVMFRFLIDADCRAWTVGPDGKKNQILCVAAPPVMDQWYNICLRYDLTARLFDVVLDNFWPSGDTTTNVLGSDTTLDRIVFRGVGGGPGEYYVDSVRLLAVEKDNVASDGTTLPLGSYPRKIRFDTPLLAEPAPLSAVIVYPSGMPGGAAMGEKVRQAVKQRSGKEVPCVSDTVVIDQATWLLREEYLGRPIIALGNASDNKAIYALGTRFLTLANRKWPGGDKFMVRSILEPFRADVNWIVVEASTLEGCSAGADALCKRIAAAPANLAMSYFREMGAAKGVWKESPFKVQGIDLSKSIDDIKEQIKKLYGESAAITPGGLFPGNAWSWLAGDSPEAAKFAAGVLVMQMERDPFFLKVGHYNYDQCIKAWQICFTSGALDEALINRAEAAIVRTAGNPAYAPNDWFSDALRADRGRRLSYDTGRHWLATAANFICGGDYVLGHCRLNPVTRAIVEDYQQGFIASANRLTDMFRPRVETSEIGDCNVMVLNLMALTGNMTYVRNGTLARAAELYMALNNNLGCYVAEGAYIGSNLGANLPGRNVIGAAAFYTGDPEFQWLWNNFQGTPWCCTAQINTIFDDVRPEKFPQRYIGLHVLPFDPNNYRTLAAPCALPSQWKSSCARTLTEPIEDVFDIVTFRDGFTPETAFLSMYGAQTSRDCMLANTIPQYTDLGQTLLFISTKFQDRWCRNGALASNGTPCQPGAGCIRKASVSGPVVSAISSVDPYNGNTQSTRTVLHRAGHYFVVLDSFQATAEDDYTFAVRWRSPNPAALEGSVWTAQAPGGVQLRIAPADAVIQQAAWEDYDGDYRPFMLTQTGAAKLKAGQSVRIRNLMYASGPTRPDKCEVRGVDENCIIVRGSGKDWNETALIGTGRSPANVAELDIQADIFYVSGDDLVAANATRATVGGKDLLGAPGPANVTVKVKEHNLAAVLGRVFDSAQAAGKRQAAAPKEYGIKSLWQSSDPLHAPRELRVAAATADRPSCSYNTVDKIVDPSRTLKITAPHNGILWKSAAGPVKLTLDLGQAQNIGAIRLVGTIDAGYERKFSWKDGDLSVKFALSDDNFVKDVREDDGAMVTYQELCLPRMHYVWAGRLPQLTLKPSAACKARYLRLTITSKTPDVPLQKVIVESDRPEPSLACQFKAADIDGDGAEELLVRTGNGEMLAVGQDGKKRWSSRLNGEITAWDAQDLESDGRVETIAYAADDSCVVIDGDGKVRWRQDFNELSKVGTEEQWQRLCSKYLFTSLTAWRPDAKGRKEVIGWPKGPITSIRQEGEKLVLGEYKDLGYAQFALADSKVLGKEVMVMCGGQLLVKDTECREIISRPMRGPLAGNGDFPVFVAAAAVAEPKIKGFLGLNPSSVEWAPADLKDAGWGEFSEVPITSYLLKDLDADGASELLIGYKDGFVRVYRLRDGTIIGKLCAGAPVVGIASLGADFVVATQQGVRLYDSARKEKGAMNIQAVSAVALKGPKPVVCVADQEGVIRAIAPDGHELRESRE